jgi:hypothetical protein
LKRKPHHRRKGTGNTDSNTKRKQKYFDNMEKKAKKYGAVRALFEEELEELEEEESEDRHPSK